MTTVNTISHCVSSNIYKEYAYYVSGMSKYYIYIIDIIYYIYIFRSQTIVYEDIRYIYIYRISLFKYMNISMQIFDIYIYIYIYQTVNLSKSTNHGTVFRWSIYGVGWIREFEYLHRQSFRTKIKQSM